MRLWLKKIRDAQDKTQDEVAEEVGISQNYYSSIETGKRGKHLPARTAKKIAEVLNFDWTKLYE